MAASHPRRTALITGCTEGGLGAALARAFAINGYHVFATLRDPAKAGAVPNANIELLSLDVTSQASIQACAAQLNLLCRLLSAQPGWVQSEYQFLAAFSYARETFNFGPLTSISHAQRQHLDSLLQQGFDSLQEIRDEVNAKNQRLWVKNHSFHVCEPASLSQSMWGGPMAPTFKASSAQYPDSGTTSPTFFPDDFLMTWIPVFLIRHPALTFESWYKVESRVAPIDPLDKSWAFSISFHYTRDLYDWYMARYEAKKASGEPDSPCPIVIDADDVLEGESLARLCEACQMDPSLIEREWHSTDVSALNIRHQSYLGDFLRSTSVDRSKRSNN